MFFPVLGALLILFSWLYLTQHLSHSFYHFHNIPKMGFGASPVCLCDILYILANISLHTLQFTNVLRKKGSVLFILNKSIAKSHRVGAQRNMFRMNSSVS